MTTSTMKCEFKLLAVKLGHDLDSSCRYYLNTEAMADEIGKAGILNLFIFSSIMPLPAKSE